MEKGKCIDFDKHPIRSWIKLGCVFEVGTYGSFVGIAAIYDKGSLGKMLSDAGVALAIANTLPLCVAALVLGAQLAFRREGNKQEQKAAIEEAERIMGLRKEKRDE